MKAPLRSGFMTDPNADLDDDDSDDLNDGSVEDRLLAHAARQTKSLQTIVAILEVFLALVILGGVLGAIAFFGS